MKKYLRILLCVFTVLFSVSLICSCMSLDDMRARQAFYDEDGNVMLNGVKYIRINGEFSVIDDDYGDSVIITEKDVPVLLAEQYGDWYSRTEKGEYLYSYGNDSFCREDKYKELVEKYGEQIEVNRLGIEYLDEDFNRHLYILTQEEQQAVETILQSDEKEIYHDEYPDIDSKYETTMAYYSEDGAFINRDTMLWLYVLEDGYCLGVDEEENGGVSWNYVIYNVPEEYVPLFDKLTNLE